jgi:hypothetical protein
MRCRVTLPFSSRTGAKEGNMSGHRRHVAAFHFTALLALTVLLMSGILVAQSTTVTILDSNGNTTSGTINNGNVFFHDSNGHTTSGSISGGNVFLSTDQGEVTIGTVRDGNVFLSNSKGVTTGTIRNGNIFLSNSNGSITTGSYDSYVLTGSSTFWSSSLMNSSQVLQITPQYADTVFPRA